MRIPVRLFALARQRAGRPFIEVELPPAATVADLRAGLATQAPELAALLAGSLLAVGAEYASEDMIIPEGVEVAFIPPVSGGAIAAGADPSRNVEAAP